MKNICVICVICGFVSGCASSGSDSDLIRRARLVANENMQLKKQLADKDLRIQTLEDQVASLQQQMADSTAEAVKTQAFLNDRIAGLENANKDLNAAIQNLQTAQSAPTEPAQTFSCEELEQQYSEMFTDLLQQLLECSQKLEEYERQEANTQ